MSPIACTCMMVETNADACDCPCDYCAEYCPVSTDEDVEVDLDYEAGPDDPEEKEHGD